jgi:hypothetical protein
MRASIAGRSTVIGTAARAIASLFGIASKGFRLREVGIFNTTTTAVAVALVRFTNATGVGAGLTEVVWDPGVDQLAPSVTGFAGHTADGAIGSPIRQATLGAAAGAGIIWTFPDSGILVVPGTANGLGIICPTGTGQILDYYYDWEE